ncbi:MAG: aminotransferase [Comamonas sp. SCN 65-56]|uniref:pyridoxal phosphate-dependent aminotransferase n=1 Tax=Comamonas sp. SCN 65-56 TaxID=1660095 RepID=UPI00086B305D|nr:pyridoxal phosphate-dependent aminotransferase [Comamonas sp. SCN 65-56]ODS92193.1 MAG: aminotransferase [Comamonas sp. SCN 65-56]
MQFASRTERIDPFYVMEMAKTAQALAREAAHTRREMIFLNVGEPDFTAPPQVAEAAERAIRDGRTQYTNALGLETLREALSRWYGERFRLDVPARRIVITAGASAALHLACLALINAGDEILMSDPGYPCNRHFVAAAEGVPVLIPTTADERYQLSSSKVRAAWSARTRGVLLASPSNPTGTSIAPDELRAIHDVVRTRGGLTLIDEIYLGLSYDETFGHTALALGDDIISINSFSKYFNMTGWRLGWMVVPEPMVPVVERLAQNLFICASSVAQHAALACFEPQSIAIYEKRRAEFKTRRDFFIPALNELGLTVPVMPDGAFYAWADCTQAARKLGVQGSWEFVLELMRRTHVAATPGRDFGNAETAHFIRFSTASSMAQLQEAVARLRRELA